MNDDDADDSPKSPQTLEGGFDDVGDDSSQHVIFLIFFLRENSHNLQRDHIPIHKTQIHQQHRNEVANDRKKIMMMEKRLHRREKRVERETVETTHHCDG